MEIKIKYSKSGVEQYSNFKIENNEVITRTFCATYQKPVILPENIKTEKDLLNFISEYSYDKKAEITHRNRINITYPYLFDKKKVESFSEKTIKEESKVISELFIEFIVPIMKRRNWYFSYSWMGILVLSCFKNKELSNVNRSDKDYLLINNILRTYKQLIERTDEKDFMFLLSRIEDEILIKHIGFKD